MIEPLKKAHANCYTDRWRIHIPYYVARVVPGFAPIERAYGYYVGFNLLSRSQESLGNRVEIHTPVNGHLGHDDGSRENTDDGSILREIDGFPCYIHNTPRPSYLTFPAKLSRALMDSDIDLVHSHTRIGLPMSRLGFKRIHLAHLHGLPYSATETGFGTSTYDIEACTYIRAFLGEVDHVICYCDGLARRVVELFRLSPSKVSVIYNGVDPRIYRNGTGGDTIFRESICSGSRPIVLFVGRAEPIKGTKEFLASLPEIFREIPDVSVVVVGSGWDRLLGDWDGNGRVTVIPHLDYRKMGDIYRAADIHVALTKVYGSQKTTIEAASCGTPVVATDNIDNRKILGNCGFYVDPKNPEEISAGVISVLRNGCSQRELRHVAERVRGEFSWEAAALRCQQLYSRLCDL